MGDIRQAMKRTNPLQSVRSALGTTVLQDKAGVDLAAAIDPHAGRTAMPFPHPALSRKVGCHTIDVRFGRSPTSSGEIRRGDTVRMKAGSGYADTVTQHYAGLYSLTLPGGLSRQAPFLARIGAHTSTGDARGVSGG